MVNSPSSMGQFERLVGKWEMAGDIRGQVQYSWAPGLHFLIQDVDLVYGNRNILGTEIIGHLAKAGGSPSKEVWSRFYSYGDGLTLDYIYEIDGNLLRVWFEDKSLKNFMEATIDESNSSFEGAWAWPGGGYSFRATKVVG